MRLLPAVAALALAPVAAAAEPRVVAPTGKVAACRASSDLALGRLADGPGLRGSWGEANRSVAAAPDGTPTLEVRYPRGSRAPSVEDAPLGGTGFYLRLRRGAVVETACLRYRVFVPEAFDFTRGGKLPGLYGGGEPAPAGGRRPKGDEGFSLRLMWRADGAGEIYLYAPNMVPSTERGGMALGTGAWTLSRGQWTELAIEARMNAPGHADGHARLWVNGRLAVDVRGIRYRESDSVGVSGLMFSTFFGGQVASFGPRSDQRLHFADIRMSGRRAP